jgi:ribulose-5-phosphate 4-epimerase/fuculose-1-phosphate aldolase
VSDVDLRRSLADACRLLAAEGHEAFELGHASVRGPGGDRFWVKPAGIGLGEMTADLSLLCDLDGKVVDGAGRLHREQPIHAAIYRARPDVGAVVHTHPPHTVAFSASDAAFALVSQDSLPFREGIARFDSARLIVTPEQGDALARALGDREAVVMRNHGLTVVGGSLEEAVVLAVSFERGLATQLEATAFGTLREIPAGEVEGLAEEGGARAATTVASRYAYLRRRHLGTSRP